MEVYELCRKLKPVLGDRADRLWLAYLAEDNRGKQELEIALQLLAAQHLGVNVQVPDVHLSAPPQDKADGTYKLGSVVYCDRPLHPFGLREDELIQHTAIFGRSGAGKTNTVFVLLDSLLDQKKPFLLFDWKRNYRDLLSVRKDEILVYTVGGQTVPFAFNPLIPPEGTSAAVWLKKMIEIIAHSYYLGEGVMYLLQEAIDAVYHSFGVYKGNPSKYPTFQDVLEWLEKHPVKGRKAQWMDSALRGVRSICFGHMGNVMNTSVQSNVANLLTKNVILELDSLTNADKTFTIESLLLWIHHYRLTQPDRETFKHAMIIEEAHHILLKRSGAGSGGEAITDTILREIRELGEGIVLVDQHPSLISIPAMGNTYATICMNLKHRSDVNAAGGAMLIDNEERELLGRLPIGRAVVKLQGRWLQPFEISIPHRKIPKGSVNDTALAQHMVERNILNPYAEYEEVVQGEKDAITFQLNEKEKTFLIDVFQNPLFGAVERYRHLHLSRRKGNAIREACIEKGMIEPEEIRTYSGKTVLLAITSKGRIILRNMGYDVPDKSRWGSLEHEFWKEKAAQQFVHLDWTVTKEESGHGYTDLVAEKNGQKIAVEIETGKSNWRENIRKNLAGDYRGIFILTTKPETQNQILKVIDEMETKIPIKVKQVQDFVK